MLRVFVTVSLLAVVPVSAFAADAAIAIYGTAGAKCHADTGHSEVFLPVADRKAPTAVARARAHCAERGGGKVCRVVRLAWGDADPSNKTVRIVRSVGKCSDGTASVAFGVGVGASAEAARIDALEDLGRHDWSWKRKMGAEDVATLSMTGLSPKRSRQLECGAGADVKTHDVALEALFSPSAKFVGLIIRYDKRKRTLPLAKLTPATGDREITLPGATSASEVKISANVVEQAVCGDGVTLSPNSAAALLHDLQDIVVEQAKKACQIAGPEYCPPAPPTRQPGQGVRD